MSKANKMIATNLSKPQKYITWGKKAKMCIMPKICIITILIIHYIKYTKIQM